MASAAPKISKLAALAATRRKKEEERKVQLENGEDGEEGKATSIALLDRLSENLNASGNTTDENSSGNPKEMPNNLPSLAAYQARKYRSGHGKEKLSEEKGDDEGGVMIEQEKTLANNGKTCQDLRALPSTFAATIIGDNEVHRHKSRRSRGSNEMTIPIKNHAKSATCTDKSIRESRLETKSAGLTF